MERYKRVPWYLKILLKIILSRIPLNRRFWNRLGVFRHGRMVYPEYAYEVFMKHFLRSFPDRRMEGFVGLELGPGDSLFSALNVYASGGSGTYLVDVAPFATEEVSSYKKMADFLVFKGLPSPDLHDLSDLRDILRVCRAQYGTSGLNSLRTIPPASVDFIWSQSVLQHVRKDEFIDLVDEMRRVIRPGGVCSHSVDLKDCLGGRLNNLRFSEKLWEGNLMARSGFYTNRYRLSEILSIFKQKGFSAEILKLESWDNLPTLKNKLASKFRDFSEEDLLISGFDVILHPV